MSVWEIVTPEATTNLITNPSFEKVTTGWTQGTGWTLTRSGTHQWRGGYSAKCAASGTSASQPMTYAITFAAAGTYTLSCWVKDTGLNWPVGTTCKIAANSLGGSTLTYNHYYTKGTDETNEWTYLETVLTVDAGDLTGNIIIVNSANPTSGDLYIDAIQVEAKAYATTYCDGDEPGCSWVGAEHASTSTRSAQSRAGGRVYDLDDLDITVIEGGQGAGMAAIRAKTQATALMAGAEYLGFKVLPRQFTLLIASIEETTLEDLHKTRAALINAIKPDRVKGAQPFKMRYTGGDEVLEITCVYDAGLEFNSPRCDTEEMAMRLIAYDPMWYSLYETASHITSSASATERYIHAKIDGQWSTAITPSAATDPGGGIDVYTIAVDKRNGRVYIGGNFTNWDGNANQDYIAYWDIATSAWTDIATGTDGRINVITPAPNGDLYVGGDFTNIGGVAANRIAKYDLSTTTWSALGTGADDTVWDITLDTYGRVYATGGFTSMGGVANTTRIAYWNGSAWNAMGTGLNGVGLCFAADSADNVYVGGSFTTANSVSCARIAKWNGTTFVALGAGMNSGVYDIVLGGDGVLYATGTFTTAGGTTVGYIASWNGASWSALGDGLDNIGYHLDISDSGLLYVAGSFTTAGGLASAARLAVWNGSTWAAVDHDRSGAPNIYSVTTDGEDLWFGSDYLGTSYYSYLNTVTHNGTARAFPRIVFERSGGEVARPASTVYRIEYIKNEDTGATLWLNYTMQDGERLTIDCTPGAKNVTSSYWGDSWRGLLRGSDLADFYLLPGANRISAYVSQPPGSDVPTWTQYVIWRETYWSLDGSA